MNKTQKISVVALAIFAAAMFAGVSAVDSGAHSAFAFWGGGWHGGFHGGWGHGWGWGHGGGWGWGGGWGGGGCCGGCWW